MRETLNPRQRAFVRLYVSGEDGVRGNAAESYKRAGYAPRSDNAAMASASKLLRYVKVARAIAQAHREADAAMIAQLRDWKTLAPMAQRVIVALVQGFLLYNDDPGQTRPLLTRQDASIAHVLLEAAVMILERAYPSRIYAALELCDPAKVLAQLLGMHPDQLPDPAEVAQYVGSAY